MKESLLILNRCISPSTFCNWSSKAPIQDRRSQRLVVGFCRTSLCWMTHWNATQKNVSSSNNLLCVWWCLEKYRFISSKGVLVLRYQDTRHNRTGSVLPVVICTAKTRVATQSQSRLMKHHLVRTFCLDGTVPGSRPTLPVLVCWCRHVDMVCRHPVLHSYISGYHRNLVKFMYIAYWNFFLCTWNVDYKPIQGPVIELFNLIF